MGIFICPYKTDKTDSISMKLVDRDDTRMADIPNDILKHMLKLLATNIGASDFVRATSSCKEWKEFAEDTEILKTVQFGRTYRLNESFWSEKGFLVKCANAGNKSAIDILVRKRKLDTLRLFMQRMKARHSRPDLRATDDKCQQLLCKMK
ncbi:uncharacterized protein LOC108209570 isoform X1 [Daucus carota subsp. sativus]|uniref:uncharacterized protein LOC108209570 isoform X1 n=1 Tax=Daucus carota subsp. sativus TaxID=79200 RepID=UPI0007EFAF75|nr:PREDICTED: uncharacterized protein LOC108209570 isoform X2 [Daucus carota subsp. sativus]